MGMQVAPVKGTASYDAAAAMSEQFPVQAASRPTPLLSRCRPSCLPPELLDESEVPEIDSPVCLQVRKA